MKKILWNFLLIKIVLSLTLKGGGMIYAQCNLIPNAGFEIKTACPTTQWQVNLAAPWQSVGGSSDYFYLGCAQTWTSNYFKTGDSGMVGFYTYWYPYNAQTSDYREYVQVQLTSPLASGKEYCVSFYVRWADNMGGINTATDNLGAYLSVTAISPPPPGNGPIPVIPQIESLAGVPITTKAWVLISGNFVASGGETYLTIGNFHDNLNTTLSNNTGNNRAYYFLDDVSVVSSDSSCSICATSNPLPVSIFTSSDTAFCDEGGKCVDFFDHSTGNPTTWSWYFPGAFPDTSTMQNPTGICYSIPGSYNVTLTVSNPKGIDSVEVNQLIIFGSGAVLPIITQNGDTLISSHASMYQWYFNGLPIAGATDSLYVATQDGSYNIRITDNIGCTRLGDPVIFTAVVALYNLGGIEIYPNPVTKKLSIVFNSLWIKEATIELYNVLGEMVFNIRSETQNLQHKTVLDVSSLAKGVYIINIIADDKTFRKRVIKE